MIYYIIRYRSFKVIVYAYIKMMFRYDKLDKIEIIIFIKEVIEIMKFYRHALSIIEWAHYNGFMIKI